MTDNEKRMYRDLIMRMVDQIQNERDLKQIFTIVHRKFIKEENHEHPDQDILPDTGGTGAGVKGPAATGGNV